MGSRTFLPDVRGAGRLVLRIGALVTVLGLAAACGDSAKTQAVVSERQAVARAGTIVSPATLTPGQAVPQPTQKPVLTLTGKISATNTGGALVLDRQTLERLSIERVRVYEPWVKQNVEFRGVWLQDLLAVAGVGADATGLHLTALDDYQIDLTMAEVGAGGIMLATAAGDGSEIPIESGGPIRIIFMDGVKAGANADQWIWSTKIIDVR